MTAPAVFFWALALYALFSKGAFYVYLPWLCLPFGALAVVDPNLTFGSTVLPTTVAFVIFISRVALDRDARPIMLRAATELRGLGLFTVFTFYAVVSAYLMPRLFAGHVNVLPLRMLIIDQTVPLVPTSANFTQAAYTVLSWLSALSMAAYMMTGAREVRRTTFVKALFLGGAVLAATGLVDFLGEKALMEPLRNGTYAIAGYTAIGNVGRITGAFPEASAFGGTAVTLVALLFYSYPTLPHGSLKRFLAPTVIALLLFLAAAATSSTAYGGLAILAVCMIISAIASVATGGMHKSAASVGILAFFMLGLCIVFIYFPSIVSVATDLIDQAVFQKAQTFSYIQRHYWTQLGYDVFWQTWGLGAGAGATRVSSWPAAIASNVGVIGICSMAALVIITLLRKHDSTDKASCHISRAAKVTLLVLLAMGYLSATAIDPGFRIAVAFAWSLASSGWVREGGLNSIQQSRSALNIKRGHQTAL